MESNLILTFGYGNRTNYYDLESAIKKHNVSLLVDVRRRPKGWSAIWSAVKLNDFCDSLGIQYLSKTDLGNVSGTSKWIPGDENAAKTAIDEVSTLSKHQNILLLCAEKDWNRCHRVDVSLRIKEETKSKIIHIR